MLSIPSVAAVTHLDPEALKNGKVSVHRALESGNREEVELTLPGLITIEKGMCIPRYPTLAATLNAQRVKMRIDHASDFEAQTQPRETGRVSFSPPRPKPKNFFTPESSLSPEDRLKLALGGGITTKKGFQVTGTPREMSKKILDWLKGNGLITNKTPERKIKGDSNGGF
jgi:electron transfer flavoprotein alpha/beta subunit